MFYVILFQSALLLFNVKSIIGLLSPTQAQSFKIVQFRLKSIVTVLTIIKNTMISNDAIQYALLSLRHFFETAIKPIMIFIIDLQIIICLVVEK